ncbi:mitochondrial cytochrome c oxidase subunit VIa [Auriculariales sp. MPI-PUGE-AT-0066]|nr:mitochondrial cytochrome c oxidase subunit VIa [Auriculariales sp. MPI-PUGE-AT-0066]
MLSRVALRTTRLAGRRAASSHAHAGPQIHVLEGKPTAEWLSKNSAVIEHAAHTTDLWRKISFYVMIPLTFVTVAYVRNLEAEHAAHLEHLKEENGGELPAKPDYPYLNIRRKPFPWGPNSLFYNSHVNKDMSES